MAKKEKNYVTENPKSMMLIKSAFGNKKSFKLIPITSDCPYVEMLFSPEQQMMVVISKYMKGAYHMVQKLDDNGDPILDEFFLKESDIVGANADAPIIAAV